MTCLNPQVIPYKGKDGAPLTHMAVPCGKCEGCLSDKRNAWIYRLENEMRTSKHSYFVTLTYDEHSLPLCHPDGYVVRYEDFVCWDHVENVIPTLYPRDVTNYLKRVRKELPPECLKYFYCGEYGEHCSNRPHYHLAIFLDDCDPCLAEYCLQHCWNLGFVRVDSLIPSRCAYVCKYILKDSDLQRKFDCQNPYYSRASHGLGIQGFLQDEKFYGTDFHSAHLSNGSRVPIPRYFRRKFYVKEEHNAYKQFENEKVANKNVVKTTKYYEQKYRLQTGSRDAQSATQFANSQLDHKTIRRVRQSLRKRKKDF